MFVRLGRQLSSGGPFRFPLVTHWFLGGEINWSTCLARQGQTVPPKAEGRSGLTAHGVRVAISEATKLPLVEFGELRTCLNVRNPWSSSRGESSTASVIQEGGLGCAGLTGLGEWSEKNPTSTGQASKIDCIDEGHRRSSEPTKRT